MFSLEYIKDWSFSKTFISHRSLHFFPREKNNYTVLERIKFSKINISKTWIRSILFIQWSILSV